MAVIFIFALTIPATAQEKPVRINTIAADTLKDSIKTQDSTIKVADSLVKDTTIVADSTKTTDSTSRLSLEERLGIKISPDALPSTVTAESADSAVMNMKTNTYYLYGKAKVNYEDMELNAGKIIYDQEHSMVTAGPLLDTATKLKNRPSFKQGQEKFTYDTLQYNFRSKRAIVRNPRTQYGEGYVFSEQVKRNPDQSIYGYHNLYTTCALDTPHFGIRAQKIKVVPGRVVASGPANLMVENVPTPLYLPFGLFPISKGQRSGFLLPTYTIDEQRGVGLLQGGYYFNLGKHMDLETRANIYSKGSWQTSTRTTYVKRYKYSGAFIFTYAYNKYGENYEPNVNNNRQFNLQWQHRTDPKARPGTNFNASVNAGSSKFNAQNTYNAQQIVNNQYQSNITYTKAWANKPYTLTIAARHSQEASTGQVNVSLPQVTFFVNQFNPFQGKNSMGTKWYEKISTSYNFTGQNQLTFTDSLFNINRLNIGDFNNAVKQNIPISANYNLFRFLKLNLNANYNEYWLTEQTFQAYDYRGDSVEKITNRGFYTARDYNASIGFNTSIYGLKMFKRGKLMGIRHVMIPNVQFAYTPDFARYPYRFGYKTITNPNGDAQYLSPYQNSLLGAPSQLGHYSSVLNFGLKNSLQIKVRSKTDSNGFKNIRLIDNLQFSSGYNLAADSFNWQNLTVTFTSVLFNLFNISGGATYDPYVFDYKTGRRINKTMWANNTGIARFTQAHASVAANLKPVKKKNIDPNQQPEAYRRMMQYGYFNTYYDFNIPWNLGLSYTLGVTKTYRASPKEDTLQVSNHNISINGDFNLTERWKITASTSYNFVQKKLQMTQIQIIRDLHCWQMIMTAVPFGQRRFYNFTLQVKATVLQDLKLLRRRTY